LNLHKTAGLIPLAGSSMKKLHMVQNPMIGVPIQSHAMTAAFQKVNCMCSVVMLNVAPYVTVKPYVVNVTMMLSRRNYSMKPLLLLTLLILPAKSFADSCNSIVKYEEVASAIYVVCPEITTMSVKEATSLVNEIFNSQTFVPDEYLIYFFDASANTKEPETSEHLIGMYYTHDMKLTLWPNNPNKTLILTLD
jgi:hypothetical protein